MADRIPKYTDVYDKTASDARYSLLAHVHAFGSLTGVPTTLAGYGIVDAAALSHTHVAANVTDFNAVGDARWSLLAHTHAAADIVSGVLNTARLGSGVADNTSFLRGDNTWQVVSTTDATKLPLAGGTMTGNILYGDAATYLSPQFRLSANTSGIALLSAKIYLVSNGIGVLSLGVSGATGFALLKSTGILGWSNADINGAGDACFARNAAGVVEINNGTAETFRDLKLRTLISEVGTITANTPALSATQTWNDAAVTFNAFTIDVTNTACGGASTLFRVRLGGATYFTIDRTGMTGIVSLGDSKMTQNYIYSSSFKVGMKQSGVVHGNAGIAGFVSASDFTGTVDAGFASNAAAVIEVNNGITKGTYAALVAKEFRFAAPTSANGQYSKETSLTELTTIAAAAFTDTTLQMPANSIIIGVSARVTTGITCTTTFSYGDSGNTSRFGSGISKAVNTTNEGIVAPYLNTSALSVRITPDTTPSDATGRVRITVHYKQIIPPTS